MKELLGFINYFVEHCNCHVVIIGDENHLEKLPKAVLGEFKEKDHRQRNLKYNPI